MTMAEENNNKGLFPYYIISYNKQGSFQMIIEDYNKGTKGCQKRLCIIENQKFARKCIYACIQWPISVFNQKPCGFEIETEELCLWTIPY